jgi:hypothetical protein
MLPVTLLGTTVPVIVPLIVQLLHVRPENGIENAPFASTLVEPETVCEMHPGGPGGLNISGMLLAVRA